MINTIGFVLFLSLAGIVAVIVFAALCGLVLSGFEKESGENHPPVAASEISHQATMIDAWRSWAHLAPTGREVFFPVAPHANPVYEITFTGVLRRDDGKLGDAFYNTDGCGNFSNQVNRFRVNGERLGWRTFELVAANRCDHIYTIRLEHPDDRLTLAVEWDSRWRGSIAAEVTLLPKGAVGSSGRRQREQAEQAAEQARRKLASVSEAFARKVQAVCIRSELFRNWGDADYRRKFAEAFTDQLINDQSEIRKEAMEFLSEHALIRYLSRHHPEVIRRFTGRLEALFLAETISVDRRLAAQAPPPLPPPPPPRKKLNAAQVQRRKLRYQQIKLGDKLALAKDRVATMEDVKAYVRAQYSRLPEDEQQRIIQQILDQIDEENQDGKIL